MTELSNTFLALATSGRVVKSSIKVSLIVGTVLALINHGPAIVQMSLSSDQFFQILLTYLVPYSVSTYSAVKAIQNQMSLGD
jgi:hypothetical protein